MGFLLLNITIQLNNQLKWNHKKKVMRAPQRK